MTRSLGRLQGRECVCTKVVKGAKSNPKAARQVGERGVWEKAAICYTGQRRKERKKRKPGNSKGILIPRPARPSTFDTLHASRLAIPTMRPSDMATASLEPDPPLSQPLRNSGNSCRGDFSSSPLAGFRGCLALRFRQTYATRSHTLQRSCNDRFANHG